jgi:hypothetical protein
MGVVEEDRRAVVIGQLVDESPHALAHLRLLGPPVDRRCRVRDLLDQAGVPVVPIYVRQPPPSLRASPVEEDVGCQPVQPRHQRRAVPQPPEAAQGAQKRLLREVLSHIGVAGHAEQVAVDPGPVVADNPGRIKIHPLGGRVHQTTSTGLLVPRTGLKAGVNIRRWMGGYP